MVLEGGEELDSRQPVEDDRWSSVVQRTMSSSLLWWTTTLSLVEAVLDSAGPESFALLVGPRELVELRPDGSLRRRRLASFLNGGVSPLTIRHYQSDRSEIHGSRFPPAAKFENYGVEWTVGVDLGAAATRWRLFGGDLNYLYLVLPTIAPTVLVAHGPVPFAMSYTHFAATYLRDDMTLVVPHTEGSERFLRQALEWIEGGRRSRTGDTAVVPGRDFISGVDHYRRWGQRSFAPMEAAAIPTAANFGVTGLYRRGDWRDPTNLEAARSFVQARFDLRIGIWDLVDSPSLRQSLLSPRGIPEAPTETAPVPSGSARRSAARDAAIEAAKQRRRQLLEAVGVHLKHLPVGWEPYGDQQVRLALNSGEGARAAHLAFGVGIYQTYVYFQVVDARLEPERYDLGKYLEPKRAVLEMIAAPDSCRLEPPGVVLWDAKGGWFNDTDWPRRLMELQARTDQWLEVFADLGTWLARARREDRSTRGGASYRTPL